MNRFRNQILWTLSFVLLLSSWLVSIIQPSFVYDSIDVDKVELELQTIIDEANSFKETDKLLGLLEQNKSDLGVFENDRAFEYVIEESDSILSWSTNKIDFRSLKSIVEPGIYNLSSRIYLVWSKSISKQKVFFLIPLKKNFEFENSFLQNLPFQHVYFPKNYQPIQTETDKLINLQIDNKEHNFYFEKFDEDQILTYWKYIIAFAFAFSIVLLIFIIYETLQQAKLRYYWKILVWFLALVLVRFVLITDTFTPFIQDFYLFQPYDFANSFIPSLGMLIINSVWLYTLVLYALRLWQKENPKFNFYQSIIAQLLSFGFFLALIYFINNIIINSTSNFIDFDNVVLRYQDVLLLLVFGILVLLFEKVLLFIIQNTKELSSKKFLQHISALYLLISIVLLLFDWHYIVIAIFAFASVWLISLQSNPYFSRQTIRLILIFIGSIFVVSFVEYVSSEKELTNRSLRLGNYQTENNRLAEYLLDDLDKKLVSDTNLLSLIYRLPETEEDVYNYISAQYITGFWSQYQEEITICGSSSFFDIDNHIDSCELFFSKKQNASSKKVGNSHFVTVEDYGIDYYLGRYHFFKDADSSLIDLYLLLKPKEQHENLGYPSILLTKEVDKENEQQYYSFAKYVNGVLVSHTGNYNYSIENIFEEKIENEELIIENGYYHLVEQQAPGVFNVISAKAQNIWNFFIILSYVFILFVASFYFVEFFSLFVQLKLTWQNTLKDKLRLSFLGLLFVTFVVIALAVISKSTDITEQRQKNVLDEKMQSVLVELKHKLSQSDKLKNLNPVYLNYLLIKFSNVFFTDINLYDLSGKLIASSRPEVFDKGLIGDRMNPDAFVNMAKKRKSKYIHQERIGKQEYLSAYIPFKNSKNESIAYLNLPYFAKDKEIKSDITILVTSFLNIFVFLFLITGLFTVFISNRITLPLAIIQQKLKDFTLKEKNERIVYKSNDEIGALVLEYNRTVEELNKNIELLAQKEREGAWKEMAKQIAHEIKNPLTPMKLSIQHLKHVWKDDSPGKDQKINDTVDLVVRQIDNLAEIATAFSDFSKMTIARRSSFDIIHLIKDHTELHSKEADIEINYNPKEPLMIFADEKQISRVFENILTNAIQAIPETKDPEIRIELFSREDQVIVQICDNGKGMDSETQERLFEPNFTTKNSGMGLGLAIVKQIVDNNSGEISFDTEVNKGTCFKVTLPKGKID